MRGLVSRLGRMVSWLSLGHRFTLGAMALLVLYYAVTWGAYQGKAAGDGWFAFLYLKSIFYYRTIDMKLAAPQFLRFFGEIGPGHHMPNRCPIGPVLVWLPFYLLVALPEAALLALHVTKNGPDLGATPLHVWVTGLGTLLAVLLGWRQLLVLFQRYLSTNAAQLGAAVTVWATPLLWYTAHHPFYQHGLAFCVVAVELEYWDRTRGQSHWQRFAWLGLLGGYGMCVRAQELVWLAPIGFETLWHVLRGPRRLRWLLGGLLLVALALLAFSPQLLVWRYYSGAWQPVQAEPLRLRDPFFVVTLFSSRGGLFPWTPLAYAAVLGLGMLGVDALRRRTISGLAGLCAVCGVAFLADLYIVSCAWMVTGGFGYGARRLSDCVVLLGLGVGYLWDRLARRRRWQQVLLAFVVFTTLLNFLCVELLRLRKMGSPGGATRSFAALLEYELHAPRPLVWLARNLGYPFCQPAGWIWSAIHHAKPAAFELVEGAFLLDRDSQWRTLLNHTLELDRKYRDSVAEGLVWTDDKSPPVVEGPVRLFAEMFAQELVDLTVVGNFPDGRFELRWNGTVVPAQRVGTSYRAVVPKTVVHPGTNEVMITAPVGSTMQKLDLGSRGGWW